MLEETRQNLEETKKKKERRSRTEMLARVRRARGSQMPLALPLFSLSIRPREDPHFPVLCDVFCFPDSSGSFCLCQKANSMCPQGSLSTDGRFFQFLSKC